MPADNSSQTGAVPDEVLLIDAAIAHAKLIGWSPSEIFGLSARMDGHFELARQGDTPARIEDFIAKAAPEARVDLFRGWLSAELDLRRRRGEAPALADYAARFPKYADVVQAVFDDQAVNAEPRRAWFELSTGELTTPGGGAKTGAESAARPAAASPASLGRVRDYELLEKLGAAGERLDGDKPDDGHGRLHGARASGRQPRGRYPRRHLQSRLHALHAAYRQSSLHRPPIQDDLQQADGPRRSGSRSCVPGAWGRARRSFKYRRPDARQVARRAPRHARTTRRRVKTVLQRDQSCRALRASRRSAGSGDR